MDIHRVQHLGSQVIEPRKHRAISWCGGIQPGRLAEVMHGFTSELITIAGGRLRVEQGSGHVLPAVAGAGISPSSRSRLSLLPKEWIDSQVRKQPIVIPLFVDAGWPGLSPARTGFQSKPRGIYVVSPGLTDALTGCPL
jgi:hypothetical protein